MNRISMGFAAAFSILAASAHAQQLPATSLKVLGGNQTQNMFRYIEKPFFTKELGEKSNGAITTTFGSLEELGVDDVFGLPGGAILPTYDPLMASKINHVLVRHEQGAGHAAQGYAMVTGRVGVCIATSGPGATNLVTAIADAHMDSVPLVAITGQVSSSVIGSDAFQEADIVGITMPITKHSFLVTKAEDIPRTLAEAFHLASTGRPGPVLVDVTRMPSRPGPCSAGRPGSTCRATAP